jgi:hypothetical protein
MSEIGRQRTSRTGSGIGTMLGVAGIFFAAGVAWGAGALLRVLERQEESPILFSDSERDQAVRCSGEVYREYYLVSAEVPRNDTAQRGRVIPFRPGIVRSGQRSITDGASN